MRGMVVAAAACVAGCYKPVAERACAISCDVNKQGADCPSGLTCIGGLCSGASDVCFGSDATDGRGSDADAPIDTELADSNGCEMFGTGVYKYNACPAPVTGSIATLPAALNTQTGCSGGHFHIDNIASGPVCVVNADIIVVPPGGTVARGTPPLVLAGHTIQLSGNLDVGSSSIAPGAGANYGCTVGVSTGTTGNGGPGGTASGRGGLGGSAIISGTGVQAPVAMPMYTALGAGCPGSGGSNGSFGGASGGLAYLIATGAIEVKVSMEIFAGGARGAGGGTGGRVGGGGGGAGGAIVLDGASLVRTGTLTLCALGGGGGGGGPTSSGSSGGSSGQDACASLNTAAGGGGASGYIVGYNGTNATVLGNQTASNPAPQ